MEGFRFLQVGERVVYELEVGEKGMKAVSVSLVEPRLQSAGGGRNHHDHQDDNGDSDGDRAPRQRSYGDGERRGGYERRDNDAPARERGGSGGRSIEDVAVMLDKMRRKQERLISLLVEKGLLSPGDVDGSADAAAAQAGEEMRQS